MIANQRISSRNGHFLEIVLPNTVFSSKVSVTEACFLFLYYSRPKALIHRRHIRMLLAQIGALCIILQIQTCSQAKSDMYKVGTKYF